MNGGRLHNNYFCRVLFTDVSALQRACFSPDSVTHVRWRKGSATESLNVRSASKKAYAAFMGR